MEPNIVLSFNVNHDTLRRGIYLSRMDKVGGIEVATIDIRMKLPNQEPPLDNASIHTLEHLFATHLRGSYFGETTLYIGPMGCRTGFYLIILNDGPPALEYVESMIKHAAFYEGQIPAITSKECGNNLEHNLAFARYEAQKFLEEVLEDPFMPTKYLA
jgi:S-ribosylhomocysteine lyase